MSEVLSFSNANPVRMVITSWQSRNASDRDYQMFRDFSLPGFDSYMQPFLNTDTLKIQFDSSFDTTNTVALKNYLTGATVNSGAATEIDDRTTYKVWEKAITISSLDGLYYIEVTGTDSDTETYTAVSEPLEIRPSLCNTVLMVYSGDETSFGIDYENSAIEFNMRVPAFFRRTANSYEANQFEDSGGNIDLISAKATRVRVLKAATQIPQWVIEKVNLALSHDNCSIDGVDVSSGNTWPFELLSDRKLWAEPEADITLASGASSYLNVHS